MECVLVTRMKNLIYKASSILASLCLQCRLNSRKTRRHIPTPTTPRKGGETVRGLYKIGNLGIGLFTRRTWIACFIYFNDEKESQSRRRKSLCHKGLSLRGGPAEFKSLRCNTLRLAQFLPSMKKNISRAWHDSCLEKSDMI